MQFRVRKVSIETQTKCSDRLKKEMQQYQQFFLNEENSFDDETLRDWVHKDGAREAKDTRFMFSISQKQNDEKSGEKVQDDF